MALTAYGDISPRTAAYAAAEMLKRAQPYLILQQFGQAKPIPANSSQTVKFRRYNALDPAITPLTEGVTPTGSSLTHSDVSATLSQFGDFVELSDVIADTHEDPVFKETQSIIGEQAAQTVETVLYNILKAGTNVYYSVGTSRAEVNAEYTLNMQRKMTRSLKRQNARYITSKVSSTTKFNTENVAPAFVGFIHPDMESTIRGLAGFIDVKDYGSMTPYEFEIGAVEDVRYIRSTIIDPWADAGALLDGAGYDTISTSGTNSDVYPVLLTAADSYATTPLKGGNAMTPMVLNPNTPREGDPMGQRGYVSWKTYFTGCILNDAWFVRGEVAVREL